jgi:2,4-dienoyl-CoA reductase (NADPH2)
MFGKTDFHKLLAPCHIGKIQTRNRMVKTAAGTNLWDPGEHRISQKAKAFYEAIARGGVGLLMLESPIMEYPFDEPGDLRYRIDDDKYIPDISELTQVIHKHGCPVFVQMYHRGPWPQPYARRRPHIAASSVNPPIVRSEFDLHGDKAPRELTIPEIEEFIELFASAAVRAQKAGFDGVELNSGSDSLLATFLSRFWNKRRDAYGCGSLENRARFLLGTIREIKKRLGSDFPVIVLINGIEAGGGDEGMTFEESRAVARMLEAAGVDALHVRSHWFGNHVGSYNHENLFYPEPQIPLKSFPKELDWSLLWRGVNVPVAARVKEAVSIPVITVGGFAPELGEKVLREGKADFIGLCRSLFADPELPNKIASGRLDDIAPCTHCGNCQKMNLQPKQCRINAALGTERYEVTKAERRKRVVVVGGGPAGMEAARVAALRGHEVILYERTRKLGGLLPMAALVKGLEIEDLPALVRYLKKQITRLGVNIRLGKEVNLFLIEEIKPDAVILATGGIPAVPEIPGINRSNFISSAELHRRLKFYLRFLGPRTLRWLTRFWMPLGKRVLIIGGAIQACELAEFLVKRGRRVTIVDTAEALGEGLVPERKNRLFWWFQKKGVTTMPGVEYAEITAQGLTVITREGKRQTIEADSIVPALPLAPDTGLLESLKGKVPEIYAIGDCREPLLIPDVIADAWHTACKI